MVDTCQLQPTYSPLMTLQTLSAWLPAERLKRMPSKTPGRVPSGTLWPHGEWSLGYAKTKPDDGESIGEHCEGLGVADVAGREWVEAGRPLPLNLSDAPNSHKPPRGINGITGYGQQMVKACGFLMGDLWPHHRKTMGTITLPPMTPEVRAAVVERWPDLTRELLQWVSRRLERQGLPPVVCSVTEVQPKRLASLNEGYLHWHLLWLNLPGKAGNWAIAPNDLRAWLNGVLERKIPSYAGGYVNVNVKPVRGEAARYLAKYMSKGKQMVSEAMEDWGEGNCPRTWWNMTASARSLVKGRTHRGRLPGEVLDALVNYAWSTSPDEVFEFFRCVEMEFDGVRYTVGYRGRLTDDLRGDLTDLLQS